MKFKFLLTLVFSAVTVYFASAQTTLWSENFNSGSSSKITMNSTDLGCVASGKNAWAINDKYTGGTGSGSGSCIIGGFPMPYTINYNSKNTPDEPAAIAGFPKSHYMHILDLSAGPNANIYCASWQVADGICVPNENNFAKMSSDVNTVGKTSVTLKFWWLCHGSTTCFGKVYYSIDGGNAWIQLTSPISDYINQDTWTQQSISLPVFDNQPTLRFGFLWQNKSGGSGPLDPSFAIDDIVIESAGGGSTPTVTTGTITGSPFCAGGSVTVPFTTTGTFNGGNTFSVYLSDENGVFQPGNGTLIGSGAASPITVNIPGGTTAGTGYRIRVVASSPATTGSDNGINLTITSVGNAGTISAVNDTICETTPAMLNVSGAIGNIQWQSSTSSSGPFTDVSGETNNSYVALPTQTTYYKVKAGSGSCAATSATPYAIVVQPSPNAAFTYTVSGNTVNFTNTSTGANAYHWNFGDGVTSAEINPSHTYASLSNWHVCLDAKNGSNCSFTTCIDVLMTGIRSIESQNQWTVFPNPVTDNIIVSAKSGNLNIESVEVTDLLGKSVALQFSNGQSKTLQINVSGLASGMYFVKIKTAATMAIQPVVKQ